MYDLSIADGFVIDGTGASRRVADVAIRDGRIAAIGRVDRASARRVIEAEGRVVGHCGFALAPKPPAARTGQVLRPGVRG
jgi:N-acyl-D-aspartate/D-glutamate deacylase